MKVNFNNLRIQTAYALDKLTKKLNDGILKETEHVLEKGENGEEKWIEGDVLVTAKHIQEDIDFLRSLVVSICCVYDDKDEDFKNMGEELNKNGGVAKFNNDEI